MLRETLVMEVPLALDRFLINYFSCVIIFLKYIFNYKPKTKTRVGNVQVIQSDL